MNITTVINIYLKESNSLKNVKTQILWIELKKNELKWLIDQPNNYFICLSISAISTLKINNG